MNSWFSDFAHTTNNEQVVLFTNSHHFEPMLQVVRFMCKNLIIFRGSFTVLQATL